MAKIKIVLSKLASQNLESSSDFIAAQNPSAAKQLMLVVARAFVRLQNFPDSGPLTEIKDIRQLPLPNFPFIIFYRVKNDEIQIVNFAHTSRKRF